MKKVIVGLIVAASSAGASAAEASRVQWKLQKRLPAGTRTWTIPQVAANVDKTSAAPRSAPER